MMSFDDDDNTPYYCYYITVLRRKAYGPQFCIYRILRFYFIVRINHDDKVQKYLFDIKVCFYTGGLSRYVMMFKVACFRSFTLLWVAIYYKLKS